MSKDPNVAVPLREGWMRIDDDGYEWRIEHMETGIRMARRKGFIHCFSRGQNFACFSAGEVGAIDKAFAECGRQGRM
jgi:hypothetical protein